METEKTLNMLTIKETAKIKDINCPKALKHRLAELGLIKGTIIKAVFLSPSKNPVAYLIRGTVIALRNEDTKHIVIETLKEGN